MMREMIADDIPQLAQLYKQFWDEESCVETMYKNSHHFKETGSHILLSAVENSCIGHST